MNEQTTTTIVIPKSIPMLALQEFASKMNCRLTLVASGGFKLSERDPKAASRIQPTVRRGGQMKKLQNNIEEIQTRLIEERAHERGRQTKFIADLINPLGHNTD